MGNKTKMMQIETETTNLNAINPDLADAKHLVIIDSLDTSEREKFVKTLKRLSSEYKERYLNKISTQDALFLLVFTLNLMLDAHQEGKKRERSNLRASISEYYKRLFNPDNAIPTELTSLQKTKWCVEVAKVFEMTGFNLQASECYQHAITHANVASESEKNRLLPYYHDLLLGLNIRLAEVCQRHAEYLAKQSEPALDVISELYSSAVKAVDSALALKPYKKTIAGLYRIKTNALTKLSQQQNETTPPRQLFASMLSAIDANIEALSQDNLPQVDQDDYLAQMSMIGDQMKKWASTSPDKENFNFIKIDEIQNHLQKFDLKKKAELKSLLNDVILSVSSEKKPVRTHLTFFPNAQTLTISISPPKSGVSDIDPNNTHTP